MKPVRFFILICDCNVSSEKISHVAAIASRMCGLHSDKEKMGLSQNL